MIRFYRDGWAMSLSIVVRYGTAEREPLGLMVKWLRKTNGQMFSEREGLYRHSVKLGPLYVRTFARKKAA